MADLEKKGFIAQPHTSAGRIPTERGYQYYIKHFIHKKELEQNKKELLEEVLQDQEQNERQQMKKMAKAIADVTNEAVVISFGDSAYYTGISHMFRKPEFVEQAELLVAMGEMFDQLEDVMDSLYEQAQESVQVLIGRDNPISDSCSMVISEYELVDDGSGVFGILGPMRMDYDTNIAILEYMESLIDEEHE